MVEVDFMEEDFMEEAITSTTIATIITMAIIITTMVVEAGDGMVMAMVEDLTFTGTVYSMCVLWMLAKLWPLKKASW